MITKPSFVRRNIFEAVFSVCLFEINAGTCSFKTRLVFHEVKKNWLSMKDIMLGLEGSRVKSPSTTLMSYSFE